MYGDLMKTTTTNETNANFHVNQIVKGAKAGTFVILGFRAIGGEAHAQVKPVNPANHAEVGRERWERAGQELAKRVQEREAVIETMALEKEALRREVAIAHRERAAIWDALGDVHTRYGGETATTLPDAVRALVRSYNAAVWTSQR